MINADRFKLRFGPYNTPRYEYGATVACEDRGEWIVTGMAGAGCNGTLKNGLADLHRRFVVS